MAKVLFIGSCILIFHAYIGYPLSVFLFGLIMRKGVKIAPISSSVTVIITVYNEEKNIRRKLENTLNLKYPKEKLQIIVASDGSMDRTNEIVHSYSTIGVELLAIPEHRGKEQAQIAAIKLSRGEIIIFTDVAAMLEPSGLEQIISNFADTSVGCVSSEDKLAARHGKLSGENYYLKYEMLLRRLESKTGSLVGLSGSFFAIRKSICDKFYPDNDFDFKAVLATIKGGMRAVNDPKAIGYYSEASDKKQEFTRKIRTVIRGISQFFMNLEFLNSFRYGLFSYKFFCHKLLRWLVPFFLIAFFLSSLLLAVRSVLFLVIFLSQALFYFLGAWEWRKGGASLPFYIKIPMYFLMVNAAIFIAWCQYLKGERMVIWTPTKR